MALVVQTIFPVRAYTPYERPPDNVALWTAIPRGMVSFTAFEAVDAKDIADKALISIPWVLPPNFGYIMESLHFTLTQNRATDWGNSLNLNLQNFAEWGVVGLNANFRRQFELNTQDNNTRTSCDLGGDDASSKWPTYPIVGTAPAGASLSFNAFNNSTAFASTAGSCHFYCRFWEFDLEQARKFPINSPLPVQSR